MELSAPAGSLEKLKYTYLFGADAAYIGIRQFSLRARADNFNEDEYQAIAAIKPAGKKLYCALNIYFHDYDIKRLEENLAYIACYPFDAFIISDIGVLGLIKKHFPGKAIHLSTQANCLNAEAAKLYKDLGFTRIIPGRELSLVEIERIKKQVDIEIEVFAHGAMCLAYSGRCYLSKYMAGRSANQGDCAHSCRWKYKLLYEEEERPGEYFPVYEGDNFNIIMSSKDICMIDHLAEMQSAGIDSLKIEGRMKSAYYAAVVTRAYRKALDALAGVSVPELDAYKAELYKVSHREFSTGFFFDKEDIAMPTAKSYLRGYDFLGFIGAQVQPHLFKIKVMNQIKKGDTLEYIGCDVLYIQDADFVLYDADKNPVDKADHGKEYFFYSEKDIREGYLIRKQT